MFGSPRNNPDDAHLNPHPPGGIPIDDNDDDAVWNAAQYRITTAQLKPFRFATWITKCPVTCAIIWMLPAILSGVLTFVPNGNEFTMDFSFGQFKIDGDPATVHDEANDAAQAMNFMSRPPESTFGGPIFSERMAFPPPMTTPLVWNPFSDASTSIIPAVIPFNASGTSSPSSRVLLTSIGSNTNNGAGFIVQGEPQQTVKFETLLLIYQLEDGDNILTQEYIERIRKVEDSVRAFPGYTDYCLRINTGGTDCAPASSILSFLYPTVQGTNYIFDGKGTLVGDIDWVVKMLLEQQRSGFTDRTCSVNYRKSRLLITVFYFGAPLAGYTGVWDRGPEQRSILRSWIGTMEPMLKSWDESGQGFRVLREGGNILENEINQVLIGDAALAIGSVLFVWAYLWLHSRSCYKATTAMLGILLLSFPPSLLISKLLFGNGISLLNMVSLWFVTGNGSDDIFVWVDFFQQSPRYVPIPPNSPRDTPRVKTTLAQRLSWTYRHAGSAMFVTSFTTAAGFFSTAISKIRSLREFGVFVGTVVCFNYLVVMTFYPACLMIYERKLKCIHHCWTRLCSPCINKCGIGKKCCHQYDEHEDSDNDRDNDDDDNGAHHIEGYEGKVPVEGDHYQSPRGHDHANLLADSKKDPPSDDDATGCMASYFKFLVKVRWPVVLMWFGLIVWFATLIPQLEPPTDLPQLLSKDSNIEMLRAARKQITCDNCDQGSTSGGGSSGPPICPIEICTPHSSSTGGSGPSPRSSSSTGGPGPQPKPSSSSSARPYSSSGGSRSSSTGGGVSSSSAPSPRVSSSTGMPGPLYSSSSTGGGVPDPPAPISISQSLRVYWVWGVAGVDMSGASAGTVGVPIYDNTFNLADPKAQQFLWDFCLAIANHSRIRPDPSLTLCPMKKFQAFAAKYYQWPVPQQNFTHVMLQFLKSDGEWAGDIGFIPGLPEKDTRVAFIRISALTFIDKDSGGFSLEPQYDYWEDFTAQVNRWGPPSANKAFQTTAAWVRMRVELAFISGTIQSNIMSVGIVAVSILVFTRNIYLAGLTTVIIIGTVGSLLGMFVLWGWKLGALESISVPTVVGLSVDYCLHIIHSYSHARIKLNHPHLSERAQRVRAAFLHIGPSIIGSSLTTIGAMIVLVFASIHIFVVIGIVVSTTLAIGIVYALGTLSAILIICGPQQHAGDIGVAIHRMAACCCGRCWPSLLRYQKQKNHDLHQDDDGVDPLNLDSMRSH